MIAPGSLAIYAARRAVKRRTVSYTSSSPATRRRAAAVAVVAGPRARSAKARDTASVAFLSYGYEFPTATLIAKRPGRAEILGGLHAWLAARWQWLRPRSIPVVVALISMLAALGATSYLSELAHTSRVETPAPMHGAHVHIIHTASAGPLVVVEFSK